LTNPTVGRKVVPFQGILFSLGVKAFVRRVRRRKCRPTICLVRCGARRCRQASGCKFDTGTGENPFWGLR
jgi:hypothetical protein